MHDAVFRTALIKYFEIFFEQRQKNNKRKRFTEKRVAQKLTKFEKKNKRKFVKFYFRFSGSCIIAAKFKV